jgi:hypothetical protein
MALMVLDELEIIRVVRCVSMCAKNCDRIFAIFCWQLETCIYGDNAFGPSAHQATVHFQAVIMTNCANCSQIKIHKSVDAIRGDLVRLSTLLRGRSHGTWTRQTACQAVRGHRNSGVLNASLHDPFMEMFWIISCDSP